MLIHMKDIGDALLELFYLRNRKEEPELEEDRRLFIDTRWSGQIPEATRRERLPLDPEPGRHSRENPRH